MLKDLSVRWKILAPILLLGFITLVLVGTGVTNAKRGEAITIELGTRYLPAIDLLLQADRDLHQVLVAERSWLIGTSDAAQDAELRRQMLENRQQSAERVDKFAALAAQLPVLAERANALLDDYRRQRQSWEASSDRLIEQLASGNLTALVEARQLSHGEAATHFDAMRDALDQLTELVETSAHAREAEAESAAHAAFLTAMGVGALAVVVILVVLVSIPRLVLKPIAQLNTRLRDVSAGGGDLSARLPAESRDELGQIANSFNQLMEQLATMFRQLHGNADTLARGVHELESSIAGIAQRSEALADISTANAASIEQITVSVSHIADNSTDADHLARETGTLTGTTAREIAHIATEAASSAERVRELAQVLGGLDERSQNIHGIVGAIREIADQTNLLALNAAIEAARAGEQGRGFAVVADEVRKLAERTGAATVEISTMLDGMRHETQQAVDYMEETVTTVERSASLTDAARDKIGEIGTKIESVAARMSEVAISINEQRSATAAIAQSTEDITVRVQETDHALQNARGTIDQLGRVARSTQEQFSRFKL
jgi:methyl-accepting chemotaxis protein